MIASTSLRSAGRAGRHALRAGRSRLQTITMLRSQRAAGDVQALIPAVTTWVERASVSVDHTVTVVMPTRNRRGRLERAVASVLSQSHPGWELLIVDDGSTDDTPSYLRSIDDRRVRTLRTRGAGSAAARNVALDEVEGEIVTFLDDDNLMTPHWLKAVVWAFDRWPERSVLYGARIVEHRGSVAGLRDSEMPQLHFRPYSRRALEVANFIDLGVLAHRRSDTAHRFDEAFGPLDDWEYILRLTMDADPLPLPFVGSLYTTSAQNRQSESARAHEELRMVRDRLSRDGRVERC